MKRIILSVVLFASVALLGGCCTDDVCNLGTTSYVATSGCSSCNTCNTCSTCSTCGYDASYTYSGWY